jgi:DNA polymerase III epsilon subunit-like protein
LTAISSSPCHLQTNHQFESVKLPSRNKSVVVVVEKQLPSRPCALLQHRIKQRKNRVVRAEGVVEASQEPPLGAAVVQDFSTSNMDKVLYVVFDLETTGRSRDHDKIIELTAEILDPIGIPLEDAIFLELIRPNTPIPQFITELTTITNDIVGIAERFLKLLATF